jgi:hypothetical protein
VAPRSRILAFGSAAALAVAGGVCAAVVGGTTGEILTFVLLSAGLGGAVLLVFLEVGLSEDRERESDEERLRSRRRMRRPDTHRRPPRRPG